MDSREFPLTIPLSINTSISHDDFTLKDLKQNGSAWNVLYLIIIFVNTQNCQFWSLLNHIVIAKGICLVNNN